MAKEWYLMRSPYDQISGFESESFADFGEEGYLEALDSEIAVTVEILNYDLSETVMKRVVIMNNHQDTKLKTLSRAMLAPIGTCKAGMYVKYKNRYWLIVGLVDDNKVFEKAILLICNYKIAWINDDGNIVERWVNAESASQYNNGESNMIYYFVRSDQLMVYMPDDKESLLLDSGKRFVIDKRCDVYEKEFDESTVVNVDNPLIVYKLTRSDTVLDNYVDSGIVGFIMTQTEQHNSDGYYVVDGVGHWLCDIPIVEKDPQPGTLDIVSDSDIIYIDLEPGIFTATFFDSDGNQIKENIPKYDFYLESDFEDRLNVQTVNNSVLVSTSDYKLNNKSFRLILRADGYDEATKDIKIREFL